MDSTCKDFNDISLFNRIIVGIDCFYYIWPHLINCKKKRRERKKIETKQNKMWKSLKSPVESFVRYGILFWIPTHANAFHLIQTRYLFIKEFPQFYYRSHFVANYFYWIAVTLKSEAIVCLCFYWMFSLSLSFTLSLSWIVYYEFVIDINCTCKLLPSQANFFHSLSFALSLFFFLNIPQIIAQLKKNDDDGKEKKKRIENTILISIAWWILGNGDWKLNSLC